MAKALGDELKGHTGLEKPSRVCMAQSMEGAGAEVLLAELSEITHGIARHRAAVFAAADKVFALPIRTGFQAQGRLPFVNGRELADERLTHGDCTDG